MAEIAVDSDLSGKVNAYMCALVELDKFSGSILIARDGEVLMSSGYGFANREHGVVNTPQTKFRLGSIIPEVRSPIQLEREVLRSNEGDYQLALGITITIKAEDGKLVATGTGGGKSNFFPESETRSYRKANKDVISFYKADSGTANSLLLVQEGMEVRAEKTG